MSDRIAQANQKNRIIVGDLKQMEARVLCWGAGQGWKLKLYRENFDPYRYAAAPIFGKEITEVAKDERQVGKVSELALGFGGGIGSYVSMSEGYKVDLSVIYKLLWHTATPAEKEKAELSYLLYLKRCKQHKKDPVAQQIGYVCDLVKQRWRAVNPEVVAYWWEVESAAIRAVQTKKPVSACAGPGYPTVTFFVHGRFLFCRLPSGRCLAYAYPRVKEGERGKLRLEYMINDKQRGGFVRDSTYGGKLTENIVQAIQRDILVAAMDRLDLAGYTIVLHVHDEIVCCVPVGFGSLAEFEEIMGRSIAWTDGLPIGVDAWEGYRYDKR